MAKVKPPCWVVKWHEAHSRTYLARLDGAFTWKFGQRWAHRFKDREDAVRMAELNPGLRKIVRLVSKKR